MHRYVFACLLLAGCPDRSVASLSPVDTGEVQKELSLSADIDILFVIDSSNSTADKQALFAANFPRFVAALDRFTGGRPNLHIGVVSTTVDVGVDVTGAPSCHPAPLDDGRLHNAPTTAGCPTPSDHFIVDVATPTGRQVNYGAAQLADVFSCIAPLGTGGCGFEAPLEAMKRALDGSRPENAGFLRPNAFLAVIILTDEDDASVKDKAIFSLSPAQGGPGDFRAQPLFAYQCEQAISPSAPGNYTNCSVRTDSYLEDPGVYANFIETLKPSGRSIVAVIGGDPTTNISTGQITDPFPQDLALLPSCHTTIGTKTAIGRPGIRLSDFETRFGDLGLFSTVCQSDYSNTLDDIGKLIEESISPCLQGRVDTTDRDANNPGTQIDCSVIAVENPDSPDPIEHTMPQCQMAAPDMPVAGQRPCWWVKDNPGACTTTATGLELHFEPDPPPVGSVFKVACATTS